MSFEKVFLKTSALATAVLVGVSAAHAVPFSDLLMGSAAEDGSAREAAMGGTGATTATGADAVTANPARLGDAKGFDLRVHASVLGDDERRSFPVHDSFSGYLADNVYALNGGHHVYGGFSATWKGDSSLLPTLGISWRPSTVFDYDYHEDVLSPFLFRSDFPEDVRASLPGQNYVSDFKDLPLGSNTFEMSGQVDRLTLAAGLDLTSDLDVGVALYFDQLDLATTQRTVYDSITVVDQISGDVWNGALLPYDPRESTQTVTGSASGWSLGAVYRLGNRFEVSGTAEGAVSMDRKSTTSVLGDTTDVTDTAETTHPGRYTIGILFHPVNEIRSRVAAQLDYEPWEAEADLPGEEDVYDVLRWRLGVEHILPGGTPFRFGFVYGPSYSGAERNRVSFTAGTGFAAGPVDVDIAGKIGYAAYRTPDLFADSLFASPDRTENDRIEERTYGAMATLRWRF